MEKRKLDREVIDYFTRIHEEGVSSGQLKHEEFYVVEMVQSMEDPADEQGADRYKMARAILLMKQPAYVPDDYITDNELCSRTTIIPAPHKEEPKERLTLEESVARMQMAVQRLGNKGAN